MDEREPQAFAGEPKASAVTAREREHGLVDAR